MAARPVLERARAPAQHSFDLGTDPPLRLIGTPDDVEGGLHDVFRPEPEELLPGFVTGLLDELHRFADSGGDGPCLPAGRDRLRAAQQVGLALVAMLGEGGGRDFGDVERVDDRQAHVAEGRGDAAFGAHRFGPQEGVGGEAARTQDRPLQTRLGDGVLDSPLRRIESGDGTLRGEQHDPPDPRGLGGLEYGDGIQPRIAGEQEKRLGVRESRFQGLGFRQVGPAVGDSGGELGVAAGHGGHRGSSCGEGGDQWAAHVSGGSGDNDHLGFLSVSVWIPR
ncbi:hypothetical protein GCM10028833_29010 [Glycomyces tarimensis]